MNKLLAATVSLMLTACATTQESGTLPAEQEMIPLQDLTGAPETIEVRSDDFAAGERLDVRFSFDQFGCVGANDIPQLSWSGAPEETQSYALIVHDPDAPTGVGFFHWVVANLPATTTSLDGELPAGAIELHTDYGAAGYGGPCPPPGREHRYVFSVYALDLPQLQLPAGATGALTRFMLLDHTLAVGRITGTFSR